MGKTIPFRLQQIVQLYMSRLHLNQKEMADRMGTTQSTISSCRSGDRHNLQGKNKENLAKLLGVSVEEVDSCLKGKIPVDDLLSKITAPLDADPKANASRNAYRTIRSLLEHLRYEELMKLMSEVSVRMLAIAQDWEKQFQRRTKSLQHLAVSSPAGVGRRDRMKSLPEILEAYRSQTGRSWEDIAEACDMSVDRMMQIVEGARDLDEPELGEIEAMVSEPLGLEPDEVRQIYNGRAEENGEHSEHWLGNGRSRI